MLPSPPPGDGEQVGAREVSTQPPSQPAPRPSTKKLLNAMYFRNVLSSHFHQLHPTISITEAEITNSGIPGVFKLSPRSADAASILRIPIIDWPSDGSIEKLLKAGEITFLLEPTTPPAAASQPPMDRLSLSPLSSLETPDLIPSIKNPPLHKPTSDESEPDSRPTFTTTRGRKRKSRASSNNGHHYNGIRYSTGAEKWNAQKVDSVLSWRRVLANLIQKTFQSYDACSELSRINNNGIKNEISFLTTTARAKQQMSQKLWSWSMKATPILLLQEMVNNGEILAVYYSEVADVGAGIGNGGVAADNGYDSEENGDYTDDEDEEDAEPHRKKLQSSAWEGTHSRLLGKSVLDDIIDYESAEYSDYTEDEFVHNMTEKKEPEPVRKKLRSSAGYETQSHRYSLRSTQTSKNEYRDKIVKEWKQTLAEWLKLQCPDHDIDPLRVTSKGYGDIKFRGIGKKATELVGKSIWDWSSTHVPAGELQNLLDRGKFVVVRPKKVKLDAFPPTGGKKQLAPVAKMRPSPMRLKETLWSGFKYSVIVGNEEKDEGGVGEYDWKADIKNVYEMREKQVVERRRVCADLEARLGRMREEIWEDEKGLVEYRRMMMEGGGWGV